MTYINCGDYLIPSLILIENETKPLGKYSRMRKRYLKEHRPILWNSMILSETLYPHLREINETANRKMELIMTILLKSNPAPDKATQQMAWVRHMNTLKAQAEEIILSELIYK